MYNLCFAFKKINDIRTVTRCGSEHFWNSYLNSQVYVMRLVEILIENMNMNVLIRFQNFKQLFMIPAEA